MSRSLLSALAVISVAVFGVCVLGYVAEFGPAFLHNFAGGPRPHILNVELRFQRGRVAVYWETVDHAPAGAPAGSHIYFRGVRFGVPDVRRSIWEYDAHPLVLANGTRLFLLAFPIWCVAIPCLIAPLLWLRKRRTPPAAAFPVIMPGTRET